MGDVVVRPVEMVASFLSRVDVDWLDAKLDVDARELREDIVTVKVVVELRLLFFEYA